MKQYCELSDRELTHLIVNENKKAYQMLFEKYAPSIYNFSLKYIDNKNDAEELVQDIFLKIWEKRNTLDASQNIKAFIFKVAINTIYDLIRRENIKHAFEDYARLNYSNNDNYTWHKVIYEEMQQKLNTLVAQLPEQQQKIFKLKKLEGYSNDEIAAELKISKRTVENHLYRALSFLKNHIKEEYFIFLFFFHLLCE